ncbi:sulfate adenylyltransferase [Raphidocelis subcapitata]|uniref:Sulfate adenylyltransferase n=1 Tax=Raphidocelis subcapitata TaxID=307507 RepID=A0A2V0PFB9_9CHLO|nr:sulfate adenylyltransferase [Raphidocelis subcapitata]|eukprot:GBF97682.1 sulfate adenylyltransferase [Raphidocelis subcapitata]
MAALRATQTPRAQAARAAREGVRVCVNAPVRSAQPSAGASRAARLQQVATTARVPRPATRLASVAPAAAAAATAEGLQAPHGGKLVSLMVPKAQQAALVASTTKTMELSDRNACDVELLCVGAFSPLEHFMSQDEYDSVVKDMRLPGGLLFGLPIVLDTDREDVSLGDKILLQYQGQDLAVFTVGDKWVPNKPLECLKCYGTSSLEHPAVQMVAMERGRYYLAGSGGCRVRHTSPCRIPGVVRYRTYEVLKEEAANPRLRWAYLPYSMHMAGPREAIQHMIIRKNYGCTHFIIGRDMAGCKSTLSGEDFYGAYDAQDLAKEHATELGMQTVPSLNIAYTQEKGYVTADVAKAEGLTTLSLSGTKFRQMLRSGGDIPEWFAFKSVVQVLRDAAAEASS